MKTNYLCPVCGNGVRVNMHNFQVNEVLTVDVECRMCNTKEFGYFCNDGVYKIVVLRPPRLFGLIKRKTKKVWIAKTVERWTKDNEG